ncbi:MAG: group II intron reverse transcriptase/maturase [Hormoscilla sp. GUM202]|nr:group II intron reverse transcriptase/maturase [Hormoscilla sp. GUM202]MBO1346836.1 group II intron reverse transcriptase/maturase [Hormoscilla sp. GUM202]MBO1346906.1 group II intron reverse transcriptase/maturase [Hormoscilla sp. GUM202]MBO1348741.1 group II intron reverse transcriptase/maturase [Hormoscilla sp. GUM202]MBO1348783.1 group II intron reverse transcriptase/maturase [Hormoscilla sp. GUM202]
MSRCTSERKVYDWNAVPWRKLKKNVFKIQKRIYRAAQRGNKQLVRKLQGLLTRSWSAKMIAVRQVTQQNQGKKTAGVDGVVALKPSERQPLVRQLRINDGKKVKPTRRVWIPKPGKDEKRPLGIPTIYDRALQGLVKIALEPEWEAVFEANSYGFRPGRGCHDAIEAIFKSISQKPKWVLDADIAKCFDKIDHNTLLEKLNNSTPIRKKIREWLKAGVMDRREYQPTYAGTPQGGVISPLLANIALHGMETEVRKIVPGNVVKQKELGVVRYADDFVIMHKDRKVIDAAKEVISKWLGKIGLELRPEKTRIVHTLEGDKPGFDFLGINIRQYKVGKYRSGKTGKGYKTLIKPNDKSIKAHKEKLKTVIDNHKAAPQAALISRLNPIIRGWCNYHRTVVSKEVFGELDNYLWDIIWKWGKRRHPNKADTWVAKKYWKAEGSRQWNFMDKTGIKLLLHSDTEVIRHVKVKGAASPMDGNLVYWSKRLRKSPLVSSRVIKLMSKQKGKCEHCGMLFIEGDKWEVDHILPKSLGGKDRYDNLQLLHDYCHHQKTRIDGSTESRTRKRDRKAEEPDEVKISRPVLKTSRIGDNLA